MLWLAQQWLVSRPDPQASGVGGVDLSVTHQVLAGRAPPHGELEVVPSQQQQQEEREHEELPVPHRHQEDLRRRRRDASGADLCGSLISAGRDGGTKYVMDLTAIFNLGKKKLPPTLKPPRFHSRRQ